MLFKGSSLKAFESSNLSTNVSKCELLSMFSLSRIVIKLVNNACKYTPTEGIITVLARVEKLARNAPLPLTASFHSLLKSATPEFKLTWKNNPASLIGSTPFPTTNPGNIAVVA